ncbi:MAG: hypothetical protein ACI4O7_10215 [Aristaeellaceae bacterium]
MAVRDSGNVEICMNMLRELDELVRGARRAFINGDACVINRGEMRDRLDRLLGSLPDALNEAEGIIREVQQVRAQTDRECNEMLSKAQAQAQQMVGEAQQAVQRANAEAQQAAQQAERTTQEAVRRGQEEAQRIIRQAEQNAAMLRAKAEEESREKVSQENVYRMAAVEADEMRDATRKELTQIRQKTFDYLDNVMGQVDRYMGDVINDMRLERAELNKHR